jgi:hypothetical protein
MRWQDQIVATPTHCMGGRGSAARGRRSVGARHDRTDHSVVVAALKLDENVPDSVGAILRDEGHVWRSRRLVSTIAR